jgi:cellulose synthase/poly-beta-1,6-N-acetylglucosamine synthase-like glycosyltransferase
LLEETDKATLQEIYTLNITTPIKIIIIPYSIPRTKPKALNYGYFFTKGEFLTVYDAEDKPDSDQLLKSLQEFNKLPQEYSCLQARLNFYNYDENILTKLFSLEYYHWFNCLLSGLERLSLPIMLGGTSNHIKSRILKKVGLWDAYNVTEDADLSLRLYSNGYKIKLLDSYTLEECPIEILSWLFQRSRWIKGMIQTIIVYVKVSILYPNQIRVRDHFSIIIFVIISTYSFYVVPIIFFLECFFSDALYNNIWKYNIIIAMTYIYVSGILSLEGLYSKQNIYKKITLMNISALALFPIYFILHVIASYLALIQVILNPFKWNKTKHGITKHINHSGPNF